MPSIRSINKITEPVRILRRIQEYLPRTIIAGGYYRDIYHNIPFSDVDIFVDTRTISPDYSGLPKYRESTFFISDFWVDVFDLDLDSASFFTMDYIKEMGGDDEYYDVEDIEMVWEISCNEIKYNVILLLEYDPIQFVHERFDFGICKTYSDGNKVTFTKEFLHDAKHKVLSFTNETVTLDFFVYSIEKHLVKLKNKFPGYAVYIPPKHLSHVMAHQHATT